MTTIKRFLICIILLMITSCSTIKAIDPRSFYISIALQQLRVNSLKQNLMNENLIRDYKDISSINR